MWPFKKRKNEAKARDEPTRNRSRNLRWINRPRADNTIQGNEAIYAAVSRIANTVASLPMHIYKDYIGLDACAANLMRPAMYGSYHHITVLGKEDKPCDHKYDVTGGLCENNDKFAIDRMLPKIDIGDIIYIHDAGAHGFSMGYNYNGKLRSAEVLLKEDGSFKLIRRAETPKDYFATFDFSEFKF